MSGAEAFRSAFENKEMLEVQMQGREELTRRGLTLQQLDQIYADLDQDGSGAEANSGMEELEASPLFFGSAGVHTTDASLKEAAMWYGTG